jgi:mannose-6-phosphate isomerase-like protein (cupin superfamily)
MELATRQQRPWGWFEILAAGDGYLVKRLCIHAGQRISLQRHHHRSEHWVVVAGQGELECEGKSIAAGPGTSLEVPCTATHRCSAGAIDLIIIEVQRSALISAADIQCSEASIERSEASIERSEVSIEHSEASIERSAADIQRSEADIERLADDYGRSSP